MEKFSLVPSGSRGVPERPHSDADPSTQRDFVNALSRCSSAEARESIPYEEAVHRCVLPLGIISLGSSQVLAVAAASADDPELVTALRFITGLEIRVSLVPIAALTQAIFKAYKGDEVELGTLANRLVEKEKADAVEESVLPFYPKTGEAAQFLARLIEYAYAKNASDIHLVPKVDGTHVRIRIERKLLCHPEPVCSLALHRQIVARVKVLAKLDTTQQSMPQDGMIQLQDSSRRSQIRVGSMPTIHGEKVVLRLQSASSLLSLAALGFPSLVQQDLLAAIAAREGLVLFAGPTGSGKTSSLYALMQELAGRNLSLVSIEDPVEIDLEGISQTSIDEARGFTYAKAMRAVLRQDPNVIMIGEMRDPESAAIAMQAAITGHLVLSTVHARSVEEILLRLSALQIDALTVAQSLLFLCCQRLYPALCRRCRVTDLNHSNAHGFEVFRGVGCSDCDYSGCSGVALAVETLLLDEQVSKLIREPNFAEAIKSIPHYYPFSSSVKELLKSGRIGIEYSTD